MSPDWSEHSEPVPYADFSDPQTLNLYGYVRNNPLSRTDADGHGCEADGEKHNWVWCAAHSIGLVQTEKEQADQARANLAGMQGLLINGQPANLSSSGATVNEHASGSVVAMANRVIGIGPC